MINPFARCFDVRRRRRGSPAGNAHCVIAAGSGVIYAAGVLLCSGLRQGNSLQNSFSKWINFLYGPLFAVIGFFYRTYTANRERVERLKANQTVSSVLKFITILVLLGWILVWMFASDESRNRLTEEFKKAVGSSETWFNQQAD